MCNGDFMGIENDRAYSEEWLTIADCAFRLKASWRVISRMADAQRIPCQERNGIRYVRPVDVLVWWLATRQQTPDAGSGEV